MPKVFDCLEIMRLREGRSGEDCIPEGDGSALRISAPEGNIRITSFFKEKKLKVQDVQLLLREIMARKGEFGHQLPLCHVYWETERPALNISELQLLRDRLQASLSKKCSVRISQLFAPANEYNLSVLCPCDSAKDASTQADILLENLRGAFTGL